MDSKIKFRNYLKKLDQAYYKDGKSLVSDSEYDWLKTEYNKKYGDRKGGHIQVVVKGDAVKLDYWLGSQDSDLPKDEKKFGRWIDKYPGPYAITGKLDGISALYLPETQQLFTRGNGEKGSDISYLLKYLKLPSFEEDVRGEIIITNQKFKQFSKQYKNSRNFIIGVCNAKNLNISQAKALDFVAYEIMSKNVSDPIPRLRNAGFKTPIHAIVDNISKKKLSKLLDKFREKSPYELDGVVILDLSKLHSRSLSKGKKYPPYSIAYKKPSGSAVTTVKFVEYNVSKHGILVPRIHVEPVELGGTTIQWAAGHNGKLVKEQKLGPGAVVEIIRSGETIPKIIKVIKTAPKGGQMPIEKYHWSKTGVDLILDCDSVTNKQKVKQINHFFSTLDAKGISQKGIEKLVENGYDSVSKILKLSQAKLVENGLPKSYRGKNIHSILQVRDVDLYILMAASPFFESGIGKRKIKPIIKKLGEKKVLQGDVSFDELVDIDGFSQITAEKFLKGLPEFLKFLKQNPEITIKKKTVKNESKYSGMYKSWWKTVNGKRQYVGLEGQKWVITGTLSKPRKFFVKLIEDNGGEISSSISKNTTVLLAGENAGSKLAKAKKLGIKIINEYEL